MPGMPWSTSSAMAWSMVSFGLHVIISAVLITSPTVAAVETTRRTTGPRPPRRVVTGAAARRHRGGAAAADIAAARRAGIAETAMAMVARAGTVSLFGAFCTFRNSGAEVGCADSAQARAPVGAASGVLLLFPLLMLLRPPPMLVLVLVLVVVVLLSPGATLQVPTLTSVPSKSYFCQRKGPGSLNKAWGRRARLRTTRFCDGRIEGLRSGWSTVGAAGGSKL
mmetsp:Transcript_35734/g.105630  ORF Transcript_35734/g.105630 Transcript_35734/m.105630 type:complete len:223 (+) Transcript_35734:856-1524(+)